MSVFAWKCLLVTSVFFSNFSVYTAASVSPLKRIARQAILPINLQVLSRLPVASTQTDLLCASLIGFTPSGGCVLVPAITDSKGQLVWCDLVCPAGIDLSLRQLSFSPSQFSAIDPNAFIPGNFQVTDNSNDDNLFVGDSFGIITRATTTTTTSAPVTTTTVAITANSTTAVAPSTAATLPPAVGNIASCICTKGPPPIGTTYLGTGTGGGTPTCGSIGQCNRNIPGSCGVNDPDNAVNCINVQGPPPTDCTYSGLGTNTPLTCPTVCVKQCPA